MDPAELPPLELIPARFMDHQSPARSQQVEILFVYSSLTLVVFTAIAAVTTRAMVPLTL